MPLFLGIDGGQSSTTVLIADENGNTLGSARGGPCNHVVAAGANEKFLRVMRECLVAAGFNPDSTCFDAACCGMSGGPEDKAALLRQLIETQHLEVTSDGVIALAGAFDGGPGIVIVGGTGSICLGRGPDDRLVRAGGWGYVFGDGGGAFDIARHATRAALRFEEGWGAPTVLHRVLLDAAAMPNANALLHLFYTPEWPRSRVAKLAALVDLAAKDGDAIARDILEHAAQDLFNLVAAVRAQTFPAGSVCCVAPIGGVFDSAVLLDRFIALTQAAGASFMRPMSTPAAGAILMAYKAAGLAKIVKLKDSEHVKTIDSGS